MRVPCYVRADDAAAADEENTLFLGVEATAVAAPLVFAADGSVRQEAGFGSVPVGQLVMRAVTLRSRLPYPLPLRADALDPTGPFSLLNALPTVPPNGTAEIQVRFRPGREATSAEELVLSAEGETAVELRVRLKGTGVSPTLKLQGAGKDGKAAKKGEEAAEVPKVEIGGGRASRSLHLGDVLVGDEAEAVVEVVNTSQFALTFALRPEGRGHGNRGALPPFDAAPCEARIAEGGSQLITARFTPDHAGDSFFELLEIEVPNQREANLLLLRGRAHACAGYLLSPEQQREGGDGVLDVPPQDLLALPKAAPTGDGGGEAATGDGGGPPAPRLIELQLVPDGETAGTATLIVGHCKSSKGDVKPAALEFSFEGLSDEAQRRGFSVEPAKGTVEPGATKAVTVSFAPSADAVKGSELGLIASFGVAQWAEAELKCVLKGGNPPPEQPETRIAIQGYIAAEGVAGS